MEEILILNGCLPLTSHSTKADSSCIPLSFHPHTWAHTCTPGLLFSSPLLELILHSKQQTRLAETRCQHIPPCPLGTLGSAAVARTLQSPPVPTPRAHQHNSPAPCPLSHPILPPYCLCLCRQEAKQCEYINISLILSVPPKL